MISLVIIGNVNNGNRYYICKIYVIFKNHQQFLTNFTKTFLSIIHKIYRDLRKRQASSRRLSYGRKKLFLLDAYALIYRAYYALIRAPRVTSSGFNTSAIFGFCNTLDEILRKENPSHIAVCFDPHTAALSGMKCTHSTRPNVTHSPKTSQSPSHI